MNLYTHITIGTLFSGWLERASLKLEKYKEPQYNRYALSTEVKKKKDYKDHHHILFTKKDWENTRRRRILRKLPLFVPKITRELHETIHKECPPVVPLDNDSMEIIWKKFKPKDYKTTLAAIAGLQLAIDKMTNHNRVHELQAEAGGLVIENLNEQRKLLAEELGQSAVIAVDFRQKIPKGELERLTTEHGARVSAASVYQPRTTYVDLNSMTYHQPES